MKILDIFFIIVVFVIGIGGVLYSLKGEKGTDVVIKAPDGEYRYPLGQNREFHINGLSGGMDIEIKHGEIRVKESSCPHQLCKKRGWIHKVGENIICIPNQILIRIDGEKNTIDAVTE